MWVQLQMQGSGETRAILTSLEENVHWDTRTSTIFSLVTVNLSYEVQNRSETGFPSVTIWLLRMI